ncbi:TM1266 family iron-only hydrogenase system putative regulator [Chitinivibrio alkaliphilus]|uniref:Putative iron-only hydrogenase system regulator n=1 Tax=Chitinivibrio alkaliphilus ACht1 TaxID=1313304 RepID=U7D8P3_9BACT|nr:TM1266 family iron-only hydrogenase system putative regulator [Chitinivibrio alkaliphilus]ERP30800.1 putative iron-only hydrogenase system regulator [Chitinivibrio alkaliphilus ACht1]
MAKRVGFVGILIEDRRSSAAVQQLLSDHGDSIISRMGVPYREKEVAVITLIVDIDTNTLGTLTGKLGALSGVSVKSGLVEKERS